MTLDKIQHIIQFVEQNFARIIAVEELEDIGCYSYRNLQRVFKKIFEESLGEFQKRLKLENGYKKLVYTNDPITDIAYAVGFESLQSFTKSFKKQFMLSPSDARKTRKKVFEHFIFVQNSKKERIAFEIVFLRPLKVYYKSIKTNNYLNDDIENLWAGIDDIFVEQKDAKYYGIIVDQPLITIKSHCRYEAAINHDPRNRDFVSKNIFDGKYAKYIHKGSYDNIEDTYRQIYQDWFFDSKLEFDSSPIIEYYSSHYSNTDKEENFITEILIPLKKR